MYKVKVQKFGYRKEWSAQGVPARGGQGRAGQGRAGQGQQDRSDTILVSCIHGRASSFFVPPPGRRYPALQYLQYCTRTEPDRSSDGK